MTETSPQTHLNPYGGLNKPGSIGIPYPLLSENCRSGKR
jgi:hypothetical protein